MPITTKPLDYYGHQFITRKVITGFMDWLSRHLYIERYDENGLIYRYIQVPVQFAHRERFMQIARAVNQKTNSGDNSLKLDLNRVLPRMSVNILAMTYGSEYKMGKFERVQEIDFDQTTGNLTSVPAPVPYTIDIECNIISKMMDDNFQIIEQLLPYFNPTFSLDMNILPNFESESVPFTLNSITPESNDEFGVEEERVFISTLNFTTVINYYYFNLPALLAGKSKKTIQEIFANLYIGKEGGDTFKLYKRFELRADNITPVTDIANREDEPITQVVTESLNIFSKEFGPKFAQIL